jgi:hypothetical protein
MRGTSPAMAKAEAKADEIDSALSAYDFSPRNYVTVRTDEHCEFTLASAFVLTYGDWYLLFAEHHSPHVFHKDDIEQIFEWQVSKCQEEFSSTDDFIPKPKKKRVPEAVL